MVNGLRCLTNLYIYNETVTFFNFKPKILFYETFSADE